VAKGRSDVELTIRARNEASKAIDSVASALSELKSAQSGVVTESRRTDSTLTQLGRAMDALSEKVGGLTAYDRIATSLQRTAQTVAQVESAVEGLREKQAGLSTSIEQSEKSLAGLNVEAEKLANTFERQDSSTRQARDELKRLDQEVKATTSAYNRAQRDVTKYQDQLAKMENRLAKTQSTHRQLTQELLRVEEPTARLVERFEKTDAALRKQTSSVSSLRDSYNNSRSAVARLGSTLQNLRQSQEQAAVATERAAAAQAETAARLKETRSAVETSSRSLAKLKRESQSTATQLERQSEALTKARTDLSAMEQAATEAGVAMERVGNTIRQRLLRELQQSKKELADYRTEWQRTTAVVRGMVAAGASTRTPTPELTQAIQDARNAKAAYQQMQQAVHQMRTSVRAAGKDVGALSAAQQRYVQILAQVENRSKAVASASDQVASSKRRVASGAREAENSVRRTTNAMDLFVGRTRTAMSYSQRLRGEVIALGMSYIGLYSAIEQLRGVTDAFMQIEAAQNRMLVAFNGNEAISQREMRWVREEADRLGIQFGVLAQEYSKFAIAARGSSIEGDEARRVFLAVAEAARVNKLSIDQMEGTYLALSQMMSKGVVSMEELRRQMGDRLYGAFTLAAEAMGITTSELDRLVSTGSLMTDQFLPKFADRLNEVFGPQLAESLDTFTTDLGKFQNEILKAQLAVADGGFIDGLRDAIISLTKYFQSDEGQRFFRNLGAASGAVVRVLAEIPQHLQEIVFLFSLLVGFRVAHWFTTLGGRLRTAALAMKPLPAAIKQVNTEMAVMGKTAQTTAPLLTRMQTAAVAFGARMRAAASGMTAARAATLALTGAMNGLRFAMALLGGIPGLIVTGVSVALSLWIGRTGEATTALEEHQRQLTAVIDAYSTAADKAGDWADKVKGVSLAEAENALDRLADEMADAVDKMLRGTVTPIRTSIQLFGDADIHEMEHELLALGRQLREGEITARDFADALDGMLRSSQAPARIKAMIRETASLVAAAVDAEQALANQAVVVATLGGDMGAAAELAEKLGMSIEELASLAGLGTVIEDSTVDAAERLQAAIDQLSQKVPSLTDELKLMESLKEIDDILNTAEAIEGLDKTSEAYRRLLNLANQARHELQMAFDAKQFSGLTSLLSGASGSIETSAALLRRFEGFRETPYWDVNAYRVGYGSDTITLADGTIQQVSQGIKVGIADANRDLLRRVGEFQNIIRGQIGDERFERFSDQQQAALTSIAYNYGRLPQTLVRAIEDGGLEDIAQAIRDLAGHNAGVNRDRRQQEAYLFASGADPHAQHRRDEGVLNEQLELEKDLNKQRERAAEQARQYHERLNENLELTGQELAMGERRTLEQEVQLALLKAEAEARRAGTELTKQQRDLIQEQTEIEWRRANATRDQQDAEERINLLMQTRRDILQQMEHALNRGDMSQYYELREEMTLLDEKLKDLIDSAIVMWQAMGGSEQAAAAIANLRAMRGQLDAVREGLQLTAQDIGRTFGEHLQAFGDNFLAKIRETGDVIGSLRETFLQFASDFLLKIAQMILQQAIFNALQNAAGGWGALGRGIVSAFQAHTGGVVGQGLQRVPVSQTLFAGAFRYHTGGIAGLAPNEVPAVLLKGEEVLTEDDPRHIRNGGGVPAETSVKIVNAIDAGSFVSAGVEDVQGQKAILNFIRANRGTVRGALGV